METRGPFELPEEDHPSLVVPDTVDVFEGVGVDSRLARYVRRALCFGHEIAQYRPAVKVRFGERAPVEVATDVHLETEPSPRVDQLHGEERLVRLPADKGVLIAEVPASVVALMPVGGDASLDELAVWRLDVAEQAVGAPEQLARLDVFSGREKSPDSPLDAVVERGRVHRFGERVDGRIVRVFCRGAIELDPHDAGSRRVGERRAEVVDED